MIKRLLNPKPSTLNPSAGFTLIEFLVVLGIMALLSSIAILYSRTGEQQILLFKEQAKVVSVILRAKSLAIQTFAETSAGVCGYGVHFFPDGRFILFKDLAEDCASSDRAYSGSFEDFGEVNQLDPALRFSELGLNEILFIPPDPQVIITPAPAANGTAIIRIGIRDGVTESIIKVNEAGQVTTQ
jgi:prepilin-type N-terminal cleavage/methylation domain-containing protein